MNTITDTSKDDRQRAIAEAQPIMLSFCCAKCGHRWESATGGECPRCAGRPLCASCHEAVRHGLRVHSLAAHCDGDRCWHCGIALGERALDEARCPDERNHPLYRKCGTCGAVFRPPEICLGLYERALAVLWPDSVAQALVRWVKADARMSPMHEARLRSFLAFLTPEERAELL